MQLCMYGSLYFLFEFLFVLYILQYILYIENCLWLVSLQKRLLCVSQHDAVLVWYFHCHVFLDFYLFLVIIAVWRYTVYEFAFQNKN